MRTTHEYEDYLPDEDLFDDPYEVVMYDLDSNDDDLYTLFSMLDDQDHSWYAKRRLNALAASGPLSALVADIIIDSLGRRWDPLLHPRDRYGQFINTGGFLRWLVSGTSEWLRGQVSRIDSDGNIHVRAVGNDRVPDGSIYRFKPEMAAKLVSTEEPVASLKAVDLDADIPDFPEATDVQKRIYNNLAQGDMPAGDLDRALADLNLTTTDFAGEVKALEDRGLIEIDKSGDKPRVRRSDNDELGVVDVPDIADVPDDDTPDLEDSPQLTRQQRELIDFIADLDRGEGDGVHLDELTQADKDDVQALIDAGALVEGDNGNLHLQSPDDVDVAPGAPAAEPDVGQEIFEASQGFSDDPDVQEAFQHFAEELARPGDENNIPLPEGLAAAKQRNAQAAANKWWEDRNGATPDTNAEEVDAPEADVPEASQANPKESLNPRNQALADMLMSEEFPGEEFTEFLESDAGVKYAAAVKRLFDAEDYEEAGFPEQAEAERFKFDREIRKVGFDVPDEDIEGWPLAVQNMREADRESVDSDVVPEGDVPDGEEVVPEEVVPEEVVPEVEEEVVPEEDVPEEDVPEAISDERADELLEKLLDQTIEEDEVQELVDAGLIERDPARGNSMQFTDAGATRMRNEDGTQRLGVPADDTEVPEADVAPEDVVPDVAEDVVEPDATGSWEQFAEMLPGDGSAYSYDDIIEREKSYADTLGLDLLDEDAPWTWNSLSDEIGNRPAELLFKASGGSVGRAGAMDPDPFIRQYENEMLSKFEDIQNDQTAMRKYGPEVMRLRRAGLIEATDDNDWRLTQAGRQRLGLSDGDTVDEPVEPVRVLDDDERDLLTTIQNGGQAKRSQRALEDALIEEGLLEEDDNGDSALTDAGRQAVGSDAPEDAVVDAPDDLVSDDEAQQILDAEEATDGAEDVAPDVATDGTDADETVVDDDAAAPAPAAPPTLPDPADPNSDTPGFVRTGGQGGVNAGGFYDVTEDNGPLKAGDKVYIKNGRSPEHAQNELLANNLYSLAGVDVPEMYLGDSGDRLVSKIIDDLRPLNIHDPSQQAVLDRVRNEFAVDSWIANWDGMNPGNTLVGPDDVPYRIDAGSAMEFRAQGGLKGAAFADTVEELTNLRDPNINYDTGIVFGPMTNDQIKDSVGRLAAIDPEDIRAAVLATDLPDKDALAEKMVTRRANALAAYNVPDPFTGDSVPDGAPNVSVDAGDVAEAVAADTPAAPDEDTIQNAVAKTQAQLQKLAQFQTRTNPHLEVKYDDSGVPIMADGAPLDTTKYYHTGKGGEGKHGLVVEVLDQERFPGLVKMEYQDGTQQVRHILGVNSGKGGLRESSQEDVDEWERQARVVGEKAEELVDPADFPMSDGSAPLSGTQVMFDVGGEDIPGVLLYFNPKYDNGGRAYIIPEGGGAIVQRPVRNIRAQTPEELDTDASPIVPYEQGAVVPQFLTPPRYDASGNLLSRYDQPVQVGDWMRQRSGGDSLVGEVVDIPDQNLYPGWVTLRFPDGEVRSRHVEGFTGTGAARGAGGLIHADAPDPNTWARVRRVKGEDGDVLSYDFSNLATSDGTPIQVGQPVFGTGRMGQPIAGLLIRINPHLKRGGEVVPTGFVWQNGHEVPVDVAKITNTAPPTPTPQPFVPRPNAPAPRPSPARTVQAPTAPTTAPSPVPTPGTHSTPSNPFPRPQADTSNPPVAYTPGSGTELSDEVIADLDIGSQRLYTSPRTNGIHAPLAAIYEAQDFDTLPQVVTQAEYARLVRDEGYIPMVRSVTKGIESTTGLEYHDALKYGAYFAGNGMYGHGSYFAYGSDAVQETSYYGPMRTYAVIKPDEMKIIDIRTAKNMLRIELDAIYESMQDMDRGSDEYKLAQKKIQLYSNVGFWAASKGYDGIDVSHGGGGVGAKRGTGFFVLFNRGAAIMSDQYFEDSEDIFRSSVVGTPSWNQLADQATPSSPNAPSAPDDAAETAEDAVSDATETGVAPAPSPGVV